MTKCNVKTGDLVVVITGKDAGKQGKVLAINTKTNRITVEGVNIVTKHQKARKAQEKSQIVKKEGSIDVSNVMVLCPSCGKPTRVKHSVVDGKNVRVCKCGAVLESAKAVKEEKKTAKKATAKTAEAKAEKTESAEKKTKAVKNVKATSASSKTTKTTTTRKSQRGV